MQIDNFDRKIISELQSDGKLSNYELADRVGLSASQCSRRRVRLESDGVICGYNARIDREKAGFALTSIIAVTLAAHREKPVQHLNQLLARLPNILEVYQVTGDMDYYVKVVTPDLNALTEFINSELMPHEAVQNVRTAIVLKSLKESSVLPI